MVGPYRYQNRSNLSFGRWALSTLQDQRVGSCGVAAVEKAQIGDLQKIGQMVLELVAIELNQTQNH